MELHGHSGAAAEIMIYVAHGCCQWHQYKHTILFCAHMHTHTHQTHHMRTCRSPTFSASTLSDTNLLVALSSGLVTTQRIYISLIWLQCQHWVMSKGPKGQSMVGSGWMTSLYIELQCLSSGVQYVVLQGGCHAGTCTQHSSIHYCRSVWCWCALPAHPASTRPLTHTSPCTNAPHSPPSMRRLGVLARAVEIGKAWIELILPWPKATSTSGFWTSQPRLDAAVFCHHQNIGNSYNFHCRTP